VTERLVVSVLGNRNSGKSHTWNTLFGETVKTGKYQRKLWLNNCEYVNVFLVSGSPEERETYVGDIITDDRPSIVLCSMQYRQDVMTTIDYFSGKGYALFVQWLNPGRSDTTKTVDTLGVIDHLLNAGATIQLLSGKADDARPRVNELRNFIYGWAHPRSLVVHSAGWALIG